MRQRPRFLDGVLAHDAAITLFYSDNLLLNKVVPEAWRFQMLVVTLWLADMRDPADPRTGLTLSHLRKLCAQLGIASGGRVMAFLNLMRMANYMTRSPVQDGRRDIQLEPTPAFDAFVGRYERDIFACLDAIEPDVGFARAFAARPALGNPLRNRSAEVLIAGWEPFVPFPEVRFFMNSDGGWLLLDRIVAARVRQWRAGQDGPSAIDLADFARRYGASRSTLRRLLEKAHAEGLLDLPPKNGRTIAPSHRLVCAYLCWLAAYFEILRGSALMGMAA